MHEYGGWAQNQSCEQGDNRSYAASAMVRGLRDAAEPAVIEGGIRGLELPSVPIPELNEPMRSRPNDVVFRASRHHTTI